MPDVSQLDNTRPPSTLTGGLLSLPNSDTRKIIFVASLLCLVCSSLVATVSVLLRPLQEKNVQLAQKTEILKVAGLLSVDTDVEMDFQRFVQVRLVQLESGNYQENLDPALFDERAAILSESTSVLLHPSHDIARIKRRALLSRVYLIKSSNGELQSVILPVHGYGLWSIMYGFIALSPDGRTIKGLTFYEQNETAGLGAEVSNPRWLKQFNGMEAVDDNGKPVIKVSKNILASGTTSSMHNVDSISGATITSNGVTNLLQFWLGQSGFGRYLQRLRKNSEGSIQ